MRSQCGRLDDRLMSNLLAARLPGKFGNVRSAEAAAESKCRSRAEGWRRIAGFRNPRGHELVRGSMGDQPTISSSPVRGMSALRPDSSHQTELKAAGRNRVSSC